MGESRTRIDGRRPTASLRVETISEAPRIGRIGLQKTDSHEALPASLGWTAQHDGSYLHWYAMRRVVDSGRPVIMHKSHATDCRLIVPSCIRRSNSIPTAERAPKAAIGPPGEDEVIGLAWNERSSVELPCPE